MNRSGTRDLARLADIDQRGCLGDFDQGAQRSSPRAIPKRDALAHHKPLHTDVMRGLVRQPYGSTGGQLFRGKKCRYRGAICALHQTSSVSSRSIVHPPCFSAESMPSRSSRRIPEMIACPSLPSEDFIAGNSGIITEEMMFAITTRTGASRGRIVVASPSITSTRSLTPLTRTF